MTTTELDALQIRGLAHALRHIAPTLPLPPAVDAFLVDLYDYFDRFADIDDEGRPNEAMQWQNRINELRGRR